VPRRVASGSLGVRRERGPSPGLHRNATPSALISMKNPTKDERSAMNRYLGLAAIVLSLAGCATLQAQDARATERMLTAAGFQMKAADTPDKLAHLQTLTPGKIVRRELSGEPSYVYADRNVCKCLYTGTELQ